MWRHPSCPRCADRFPRASNVNRFQRAHGLPGKGRLTVPPCELALVRRVNRAGRVDEDAGVRGKRRQPAGRRPLDEGRRRVDVGPGQARTDDRRRRPGRRAAARSPGRRCAGPGRPVPEVATAPRRSGTVRSSRVRSSGSSMPTDQSGVSVAGTRDDDVPAGRHQHVVLARARPGGASSPSNACSTAQPLTSPVGSNETRRPVRAARREKAPSVRRSASSHRSAAWATRGRRPQVAARRGDPADGAVRCGRG